MQSVRWLDARPFGVGTTRSVTLAGGIATVRERFFRWEENLGYSFYLFESTRPGLRRVAEDYALEPDGNATALTWTVAIEPTRTFGPSTTLLAMISKQVFGRLAADGRRYFAASRKPDVPQV